MNIKQILFIIITVSSLTEAKTRHFGRTKKEAQLGKASMQDPSGILHQPAITQESTVSGKKKSLKKLFKSKSKKSLEPKVTDELPAIVEQPKVYDPCEVNANDWFVIESTVNHLHKLSNESFETKQTSCVSADIAMSMCRNPSNFLNLHYAATSGEDVQSTSNERLIDFPSKKFTDLATCTDNIKVVTETELDFPTAYSDFLKARPYLKYYAGINLGSLFIPVSEYNRKKNAEEVSHFGLTWFKGLISYFGGKTDPSTYNSKPTFDTRRMRDLGKVEPYFLALPYLTTHEKDFIGQNFDGQYLESLDDVRRFLRQQKIILINKNEGSPIAVIASLVDKGPASWTKRAVDVSPATIRALNLSTDDEVLIAFAKKDSPTGPVKP